MTQASAYSQAQFSAALLDPALACPAGLKVWNGSDPAARLAVYRNNVVSSLIDALASSFPVVQELVGTEFFRAMAAVFVRQAPPRTRILAHYGGELFPLFIAGFEPASSLPYLADMARLEAARVRAYHAGDAAPVDIEAVQRVLASGERVGELRLDFHPSVSALGSRFAVLSLWAAHQGVGELADVDIDQAETAIMLRPGLEVLVLRAPLGAADFVAAVQQGRSLADAVEAAAGHAPAFDVQTTLSLLVGQGAVRSIYLPGATLHA